MADSEDLELLMSGEIDLSRCDFREAKLNGMDLRGRNFSHCLLQNAECRGTKFDGSNFNKAEMSFMKASNASFDGCMLEGRHFGYVDLSGASLKNVKAKSARFQHVKLNGADLRGAEFIDASFDADTDLNGVISDKNTNFEGLKVLRPTSRNELFRDYDFIDGVLQRRSLREIAEMPVVSKEVKITERMETSIEGRTTVAQSHIRHLLQNAMVTQLTAQQLAYQIETALCDIPATNGNQLVEPLQTILEFASVLRNIAPANGHLQESLVDREKLKERITELEVLVAQLTRQLSDESEARKTAEALASNNGFWKNFKKTAGQTMGVGAGGLASGVVAIGVTTAASYFLGNDHPVVTSLLNVISQSPR